MTYDDLLAEIQKRVISDYYYKSKVRDILNVSFPTTEIVISVPVDLVCNGFDRPFRDYEKDILIKAIGNGKPYKDCTVQLGEIINIIHTTVDHFIDYDGVIPSVTDNLILDIRKAICNNIGALFNSRR